MKLPNGLAFQLNNPLSFEHVPNGTGVYFSQRKQFMRLLAILTWRWLLNVVLCLSTGFVLYAYTGYSIITSNQKNVFNTVILGLIIGITTNLTEALRNIASKWKWYFLSRKSYPPDVFNLIMGCDNQLDVLRLLVRAWRSWRISLLCIFWLALNLGSQILVALLGLTYTVAASSGFGSVHALTGVGPSYVANLSYIAGLSVDSFAGSKLVQNATAPFVNAQLFSANEYGIQSNAAAELTSEDVEVMGYYGRDAVYSVPPGFDIGWYIAMFNEPIEETNPVVSFAVSTARFGVTYANCSDPYPVDVSTSPNSTSVTFPESLGGGTLELSGNKNGTTCYFADMNVTCGDRCLQVTSVHFNAQGQPQLYSCESRVAPLNITGESGDISRFGIPDQQALMMAGAIAWGGDVVNGSLHYHTYTGGTRWSMTGNLTAFEVSKWLISRFSIGVIYSMDNYGPHFLTTVAHAADTSQEWDLLRVTWTWTLVILLVVVLAHLSLILLTAAWLRTIYIRDDGALATAVALRHIVKDIPASNSMKSKRIAGLIDGELRYSWVPIKSDMGDMKALHIDRPEALQPHKTFEDGYYE